LRRELINGRKTKIHVSPLIIKALPDDEVEFFIQDVLTNVSRILCGSLVRIDYSFLPNSEDIQIMIDAAVSVWIKDSCAV
jgi:hypothetical protein